MAVVYSVMDGRGELRVTANPERGVVVAKEGFYVMGACNPNAPGAIMSEALLSRFRGQFEVGTDFKLAGRLGVHPKAVTAAQNLSAKRRENTISWAPQLRELLAFKEMSDTFGQAVALSNIVACAPERDRATVMDVFGRTFGEKAPALKVR